MDLQGSNFSGSRDQIFNSKDLNRVPKTPYKTCHIWKKWSYNQDKLFFSKTTKSERKTFDKYACAYILAHRNSITEKIFIVWDWTWFKLRVQNNIHFNLTPLAPSGFSCKCHIFVPLCNSLICQSFVQESSTNLQKTWRVF